MSTQKKAVMCAVTVIIGIIGMKYAGDVRTSATGLALIGSAESCRRDPYLCPAERLTAGVGSTTNINAGVLYSDDEIAAMWVKDIRRAERCINRNFNGENMGQGPFDAMTSAAFNTGCLALMWFTDSQGIQRRTTIWRYAQEKRWREMCDRLPDFVNAAGRRLPGLVKRREAERQMCLGAL